MKNLLVYPFYFLLFHTLAFLNGNEIDNESALYALTSLRCHIVQEIKSNQKTTSQEIIFEQEDIFHLWEQAKQSTETSVIQKAESHYIHAQRIYNQEEVIAYLCSAKELVDKAWKKLNPYCAPVRSKSPERHRYFLPEEHWLKFQLDTIFSPWEVLKNERLFYAAGFKLICKRSSDMIVAQHDNIPDYLIKTYLLSDKPSQTWKWMINRCLGAENIRNLIKEKKLRYFTVPEKWIYPLPNQETEHLVVTPEETAQAVLVVTHMKIGDYRYSKDAWKTEITRAHLRELYCILSYGFASCYLAQNIPYTKNGIFTCLDTEYPYRVHHLKKARGHLSPEMKIYWDLLIKTGGKGK